MSEALFSQINPIVSLSRRARRVAEEEDEAGAEQDQGQGSVHDIFLLLVS